MNGIPFYILQNQQQQDNSVQEMPPARVLVALRFLDAITAKKQPRAYSTGEYHTEIVPGLELTPTEVNAEHHAHNLLIDYFDGKLKPDWREQLDVELMKSETIVERPVQSCPSCNPNNPRPDCIYCDGTGRICIYPATKRNK
jgi:hypothetical protein